MNKKNIYLQIKLSQEQKDSYRKVAEFYNMPLSTWAKFVLDKEVRKEQEKN